MECLLDCIKCVNLVLSALEPSIIELFICDVILFLFLVDKSVWEKIFTVDTCLSVLNLSMASIDFELTIFEPSLGSKLFTYVKFCSVLLALQLSGLHAPLVNVVVHTNCLELVLNLHSVQILVSRLLLSKLNHVLVQEREHLQTNVDAFHVDEFFISLAEDNLVIATNYSVSNWY